jgi:branched-subunit amino acid aminotransferase/4-amino-4-deoxychorismate lyase
LFPRWNHAAFGDRACQERQIPVHERAIARDELTGFEECFLTGTAAEVTPVSEIGPYRFKPGKLSETLMNDYADLVRRPPANGGRVNASA